LKDYDQQESEGTHIKNSCSKGKFAGDTFGCHFKMSSSNTVVVTHQRLIVVKSSSHGFKWQVPLSEIQEVIIVTGEGVELKFHPSQLIKVWKGPQKHYLMKADEDSIAMQLFAKLGESVKTTSQRAGDPKLIETKKIKKEKEKEKQDKKVRKEKEVAKEKSKDKEERKAEKQREKIEKDKLKKEREREREKEH